jgi:hypothetical protein
MNYWLDCEVWRSERTFEAQCLSGQAQSDKRGSGCILLRQPGKIAAKGKRLAASASQQRGIGLNS